MKIRLTSICTSVLCLFLATGVYAQQSGTLKDIAFIQGHWKAQPEGSTVEAVWSAPAGDNMAGHVRIMKDNKASLYELFAIEQTSEGLKVFVKHFRPGLIGLEEKEESDRYTFVEAEDGRAVFKKEGEELRVLYEKRGNKQFAIALGKKENGEWAYKDFWLFSKVK